MGINKLQKEYRCLDDYKQSGCPKHIAKLEFYNTTNGYKFDNGKGNEYYFEEGELQAFVDLLKELKEIRVDSVSI